MSRDPSSAAAARPAVSVILPFHGGVEEADSALAALGTLELRPGDEVLVADNTEDQVLLSRPGAAAVSAFECEVKRSAYAARNLAAERAVNDWLLLLDADCRPRPDLIDRYFEPPPGARAGAVAGQVLGVPDQPGIVPRYIRERRHLDQVWLLEEHPYRPMAVTANLLLRRSAWEAIGGFAEQTRSGADSELSWRLQDAGWELELREQALVHHEHRASLPALLKQSARDGAGARWASRRYPGHPARPRVVHELVRAVGGALVWTLRGQRDPAAFKLIDGAWVIASAAGSLQSNAAPLAPAESPVATVLLLDRFPLPGDATVGLAGDRAQVRIEARARPERTDWALGRRHRFHLAEDDGPGVRAAALAQLALRRPLVVARALAGGDHRRVAALAPAARRLARDPEDARVVAAPERAGDAELLLRLAGRRTAAEPA